MALFKNFSFLAHLDEKHIFEEMFQCWLHLKNLRYWSSSFKSRHFQLLISKRVMQVKKVLTDRPISKDKLWTKYEIISHALELQYT